MASRRKVAPVPEQEQAPTVQLEDPDARIRIVMAQWGKATETAMSELDLFAPGWAGFLRLTYDVVDAVMRGDN